MSLGAAALTTLLAREGRAATAGDAGGAVANSASRGVVNPLHLPQRAKRVIFLCMAGGPSHLETFDEKPRLAELSGQPMPDSYTKGQPIAQLQGKKLVCWGPQAKYTRHGQSGQLISDHLPNIAGIADDICIVRSLKTAQINHDPAHTFMNTGTIISGRPSMGAWVNYGLGSECDDLPGFVVLASHVGRSGQPISSRQWDSGFLPSRFQGVMFNSVGDAVHYVSNPPGVDRQRQGDVIDAVVELNRMREGELQDPDITTRIAQYELAFRMQMSVPELVDISGEPQHILDSYGVAGADGSFAYNCLLARRMAERGGPVHSCLPSRLGPSRFHSQVHEGQLRVGRQTNRRTHQRPQTARHARRHASHLGRRIWPHADGAEYW